MLSDAPPLTPSPESVSPPVGENFFARPPQNVGEVVVRTLLWGVGVGVCRYAIKVGTYVIHLGLKHVFPKLLGEVPKAALSFSPYLFNGFLTIFVWQTARLVSLIAWRFLGERPPTIDSIETITKLDCLRKYSWKVIFYLEETHKKVDQKFSRLFGIHTLEEIQAQKIEQAALSSLEIFRQACIEFVEETFGLHTFTCMKSLAICEVVGFIPLEDRWLTIAPFRTHCFGFLR